MGESLGSLHAKFPPPSLRASNLLNVRATNVLFPRILAGNQAVDAAVYTVRFFIAAALVNQLEEKQKPYLLDRFFAQLDGTDLLIVDAAAVQSCCFRSLPTAMTAGACS